MKPDVEDAFQRLVAAIAGSDPLPAGGAAGVAALAMGTALGIKVLRLSDVRVAELERLLERLVPQFRMDCEAFEAVLEAFRIPRDDPARIGAIQRAWCEATAAPVSVAGLATEVEKALERCADQIKDSLQGDLGAALTLVCAGRRIASDNARDNARHLDSKAATQLLEGLG